jgi:hypothetical protein
MNSSNTKQGGMIRAVAYVFICIAAAVGAWSQDTTSTTVQHGPSSFDTQVRNAEVIYVEGNHLVVKTENGAVEDFNVPDGEKFTVDGKGVAVGDLAVGTKLTQTITTTTTPRRVTSIRTIKGKVWHVNAPKSVILTLPDGKNKQYTVPDHAKFTLDGQPGKTVFDLKKGMNVEATVVTDSTHDVIEESKNVVGQAPAPPDTPQEVGILLIVMPMPAAPMTMASAEQPPQKLPKTGTSLPLIGLLGALAVAMSVGMRSIRRLRA